MTVEKKAQIVSIGQLRDSKREREDKEWDALPLEEKASSTAGLLRDLARQAIRKESCEARMLADLSDTILTLHYPDILHEGLSCIARIDVTDPFKINALQLNMHANPESRMAFERIRLIWPDFPYHPITHIDFSITPVPKKKVLSLFCYKRDLSIGNH